MRVLAAMSGGVDSAVAAARAVDAGHDVVGVHLALARNPAHPAHRRPRLLHDRGRPRRPPRRRRPRHPLLRLGPGGAVRARRHRGLRRRVRRRPHAQPLRALQRADQVLRAARQGAGARLRRRLHRPLRAPGARARRRSRAAPGGRPGQGPVVRARRPHRRSGSSARCSRWGTPSRPTSGARRASAASQLAAKPDSHDICFVADGDTKAWLGERLGRRPGPIVDAAGERRRRARRRLRLHGRPAARAAARPAGCRRGARGTCSRSGPRTTRSSSAPRAAGRRQRRGRRRHLVRAGTGGGRTRVGVQVRAHGEELPGVVEALAGDAVRLRLDRAGAGGGSRARRPRSTPARACVGSATITPREVALTPRLPAVIRVRRSRRHVIGPGRGSRGRCDAGHVSGRTIGRPVLEPVPGRASGVGSWPGTDVVDAVRTSFGELPEPHVPYLPELPGRGPGADLIGRAAALLVDMPVDLQPVGVAARRPARAATSAARRPGSGRTWTCSPRSPTSTRGR